MATLKMKKLPKAPKASASIQSKENYLKRVAEIKRENNRRAALNKKSDALSKKIAGVRSGFRK